MSAAITNNRSNNNNNNNNVLNSALMQFCCMTVFQPVTARSDMPIFTFFQKFFCKNPSGSYGTEGIKKKNNNNNNRHDDL